VVAALHRDLGLVLIAGIRDIENGKSEVLLAVQTDPTIQLDKDLATDEFKAAFEEARAQVGVAAPPPKEKAAEAKKEPEKTASPSAPGPAVSSSLADDCPPDFPGCGDDGFENSFCDDASPCPDGYECEGNECHKVEAAVSGPSRKNWLGVAVQQDWLFLTQADNICSGTDYYCFGEGTTTYFTGTPEPEVGNNLDSTGAVFATTRILLTYDRALTSNISVGARAGFALGGGPAAPNGNAFVPLHAEVRGSLWFGKGVFSTTGLRPYVFLGGGMAQVDGKITPIKVRDQSAADRNAEVRLDAWRKTGLSFVSLGGGMGYAVSPAIMPFLEVKLMQLLGAAGTAGSLQLGGSYGF
jgi:hypothetical protein